MVSKTFGNVEEAIDPNDLDTVLSELEAGTVALSAETSNSVDQLSSSVASLESAVGGTRNISNDTVNGVPLATELAAIRALIGTPPVDPAPPTPNVAPYIDDITPDVGQTVTITAGTYTGTSVTSRTWQVWVNGLLYSTTASTSFVVPVSAGTGARSLRIVELASWASGVVQFSSDTYTVNAPAAYSNVIVNPSITGTAAVGNTLTLNAGTWDTTPTSYEFNLYRGGTPAQGGVLIDGPNSQAGLTRTYVALSADAAATLVLEIYCTNAAGENPTPAYSSPVVVSGGVAPSYNDASAVLPGIEPGTYEVGQTITLNFGTPINNPSPTGYEYQVTRDGVDIAGAGGTGKTNPQTYLLVSSDQDKTIAFRCRASNAAGTSAWQYAAGVVIDAAQAGGGAGALAFGTPAAISGDLTTDGTVDWVCFTNATLANCEQKASPGAVQISAYSSPAQTGATGSGLYTWSDGTPTTNGTAPWQPGADLEGDGTNATLAMGADTTQRTAYLYIEAYNSTTRINVSLSDDSATPQQLDLPSGAATFDAWRVPIVYKAGSGSQTLNITVTSLLAPYTGWPTVWLDAAAIGA